MSDQSVHCAVYPVMLCKNIKIEECTQKKTKNKKNKKVHSITYVLFYARQGTLTHILPILILRAEVSCETAGMNPAHFLFNYPVHFIQFSSMFSVFWKCF